MHRVYWYAACARACALRAHAPLCPARQLQLWTAFYCRGGRLLSPEPHVLLERRCAALAAERDDLRAEVTRLRSLTPGAVPPVGSSVAQVAPADPVAAALAVAAPTAAAATIALAAPDTSAAATVGSLAPAALADTPATPTKPPATTAPEMATAPASLAAPLAQEAFAANDAVGGEQRCEPQPRPAFSVAELPP